MDVYHLLVRDSPAVAVQDESVEIVHRTKQMIRLGSKSEAHLPIE
jgi:hypothetical protein